MSDELKEGGLFVDTKPAAARPVGTPAKKDVKKRWVLVMCCVGGFALVVSTLLSDKAPLPVKKEEQTPMINVTPNVDERSWQVRSQADIQNMKTENDRLRNDIHTLRIEIEKIKNAPPVVVKQPAPSVPSGVVPPPSSDSGVPPLTQAPVPPPPMPLGSSTSNIPKPPAVPPPFSDVFDAPAAEPLVFTPGKRTGADGPEVGARIEYKKNANSGLMTAGAFAPVVLLNGVDAGTSSGSRSNPQPLLMRVQDHAILPGAAKYSLRSCFLLGSGYGELSAERVYIRLARLSCVDKSDRLVLSVDVQGYVVDSDNTLGMRGKVTNRQGARLGKALLAGFAQGLSGALSGAQGTVSSSVLGNTTSITGDEALRASGLSGASTAAGQLADFYLKEAQSIFPIISIEGGRDAYVVFTEDVKLSWGNVDAQFIRNVTPDNQR
jgi:conjugal transfer pilus assembly protein TraB